MKDFLDANRLRTIGLPGLIVALALHPFVGPTITRSTSVYGLSPTAAFFGEIVLFGLIISSAARWVYYVYEGHRLSWLTALPRRLGARRASRLHQQLQAVYGSRTSEQLSDEEERSARRLNEQLMDYFDENGVPAGPTRLANIVASYERYPKVRYKINGREFWNHILVFGPEALRKDLDDRISMGQSMVLASAAAFMTMLIGVLLMVGVFFGRWVVLFTVPFGMQGGFFYVMSGLLSWAMFYQLSLGAHHEVRATFRAIVDTSIEKFVEWLRKSNVPLDEKDVEKAEKLWHYLAYGE